MRIGLLVPHIFMQDALLPHVIFSPGHLAIDLADGLVAAGHNVTLFSAGPVQTKAKNQTANLQFFEDELKLRGYGYIELLKKHPLTFISLARQAQSELLAEAFKQANADSFDILHIYTNEEDVALPFIQFCTKPVVLTHHDPFNFSTQYRTVFPKYRQLNWLSMSLAQSRDMPADTNWVANIYHGLVANRFDANLNPRADYVAYCGRIVEAKGVHLAIAAVTEYNRQHITKLKLRIAGKHYAGGAKDDYWQQQILPQLGADIIYDGFLSSDEALQDFLGNARALLMPSTFNEPFGLVMAEALACGTPIIGLNNGAIPEIITPKTGFVVEPDGMTDAIGQISSIRRRDCRQDFEDRFTVDRMTAGHIAAYESLIG